MSLSKPVVLLYIEIGREQNAVETNSKARRADR
jgi:hypothetical protein